MAVAAAIVFVMAVFCVHESAYKRDELVGESENVKSWWETLSLTMGYDNEARFWTWVSRTLVLLAYPPVLIAGLTIGVFTGW
jgi:TRAP-type C4-dicarboxylate transport system permease large subunit